MKNEIAIVILARGKYSKRIPHKPLEKIGNKTLMEWTLDIAVKLPYPIFVYTDMQEIKDLCGTYKIYSCGRITIRDKKYENKEGIHHTGKELIEYNKEVGAKTIILLQVTSPFRDISLIKLWIETHLKFNRKCGFAARTIKDGFYYDMANKPINYDMNERTYNGCRKSRLCRETGSFYIFEESQLYKKHILNGDSISFPDPYNIDIDIPEDLKKAREFYNENKVDIRNRM